MKNKIIAAIVAFLMVMGFMALPASAVTLYPNTFNGMTIGKCQLEWVYTNTGSPNKPSAYLYARSTDPNVSVDTACAGSKIGLFYTDWDGNPQVVWGCILGTTGGWCQGTPPPGGWSKGEKVYFGPGNMGFGVRVLGVGLTNFGYSVQALIEDTAFG